MIKKYYNIELDTNDAAIFRAMLHAEDFTFESSGAGDMVHFEVFIVWPSDLSFLNEWIAENLF